MFGIFWETFAIFTRIFKKQMCVDLNKVWLHSRKFVPD